MHKLQELQFTEEGHVYRLNGKEIPSVTQIMEPLRNRHYAGISEAVLNNAGGRGTSIHQSIEIFLTYGVEDVKGEYRGYLDAFMDWQRKESPEQIKSELRAYHKLYNYAGTVDIYCCIGGMNYVIDIKTASTVSEMLARVQLEAYVKMLASHRLEVDKKAILHIRNGSYSFTELPLNDNEAWTVFGGLINIHNYLGKYGR